MKIITHFNVDLDAVASVWAAKKFLGFHDAQVEFVPANWQGPILDGDIAVDIAIGTKGTKDKCAFRTIMDTVNSSVDISDLITYVNAQDCCGNAVKAIAPDLTEEVAGVLNGVGLNTVLRAFQTAHPRNDALVLERMCEIFDGLYAMKEARARAKAEAETATFVGNVAIIANAKEFGTNGELFAKGAKAVIYIDGNNLGVVKREDSPSLNDGRLKTFIENHEEEGWFFHPAGFMICRGSRKAPSNKPSKVNPIALAEEVSAIMQ